MHTFPGPQEMWFGKLVPTWTRGEFALTIRSENKPINNTAPSVEEIAGDSDIARSRLGERQRSATLLLVLPVRPGVFAVMRLRVKFGAA